MTYTLFLLPDTCLYYPQCVIHSLESQQDAAVVITLDKTYLASQVPQSHYLERTEGEHDVVPNSYIIDYIQSLQPNLVVLDDCFWDYHRELLDEVLELQKEQPFHLIHVTQFTTTKYETKMNRMKDADTIYVPSWDPSHRCHYGKTYQKWTGFTQNLSFYEQNELINRKTGQSYDD